MQEVIQLFKPNIGELEIAAAADALRSGWIGLGPKTEEFERAFAAYLEAPYAVGMNSCTAALDMAVRLLDLRPGDEIVVPTITFVSTAHAVVYNRCRPVFVDVEPDTLNISIDDLKRKITTRTKAVMVVHYAGRPVDLDAVMAVAGDLPVIEDCAHATGARYKERLVGSRGKFGCFSFHAVKNLTMGEGGALVLKDVHDYERAKQLRWLGIDKGTWERTPDNKEYWWEYAVNEIGLKCHLNDIMAAIGLVQLERLTELNGRRRHIAETYREAFADLAWLRSPPKDDETYQSAWHVFSAQVVQGNRNDFSQYLRERGVMTGVHYKPIHLYRCYGYQPPLPVAEEVFKRIISIPNHAAMTDKEVETVINAVRSYKP